MKAILYLFLLAFSSTAQVYAANESINYPNKPIKIVVPFSAGSATDFFARVIADELTQLYNNPVVVENKAGASGFIASSQVARSAADGYTLLVTANTTHAGNPALFKSLPYDPVTDFTPIAKLGTIPLALVVNSSIPVNNTKELIQYAKDNPGRVFFGSGSTSARVAGEMLKSMADIDIANVQYKSNPEAVTDLMGGQIQMMIADVATTLPATSTGKVKALAVSTQQPSALAPGLPTIAQDGALPGFEMVGWFAAYAPQDLPPAITESLSTNIKNILAKESVQKKLNASGIEAEYANPAELTAFQASETDKWIELVKKAGIPVQ